MGKEIDILGFLKPVKISDLANKRKINITGKFKEKKIGGGLIKREKIYDTYWRWCFHRQEIFFKRFENSKFSIYMPDRIFSHYKFCNVYRASDRVSQYLIKNIIYKEEAKDLKPEDHIFRILFFRLLNRYETWTYLEEKLGLITYSNYDFEKISNALLSLEKTGNIVYGSAFMLSGVKIYNEDKKFKNHLKLMEVILNGSFPVKLAKAKTMREVYEMIGAYPLIGKFMAYQMAIDLNYSELINFSENDFTVAGPGAERGIAKCFVDIGGHNLTYVINYMVDHQEEEFKRLNLDFKSLWGRPMHAIDCQNVFCETDKYCREAFPELSSNRSRIKTEYKKTTKQIDYFYPPKWNINDKIKNHLDKLQKKK